MIRYLHLLFNKRKSLVAGTQNYVKIKTMKKQYLLLLFLLFSLFTWNACVKDKSDDYQPTTTTSTDDIVVPESFNYSSTKSASIQVTLANPEKLTAYKYIVKIFSSDPDNGGALLYTSVLPTDSYTLITQLTVPTTQNQVWIQIYLGNDLVKNYTQTI